MSETAWRALIEERPPVRECLPSLNLRVNSLTGGLRVFAGVLDPLVDAVQQAASLR